MGQVVEMKKSKSVEKKALVRQKKEMTTLWEVNAYVNHNPQSRVTAGMTHSKTMHEGVDLRTAIAKYDRLAVGKVRIHPLRMDWAIARFNEDLCLGVLLVRMPDGVYVLGSDDEVIRMDRYEHKIEWITQGGKIGVWIKTEEIVNADDTE